MALRYLTRTICAIALSLAVPAYGATPTVHAKKPLEISDASSFLIVEIDEPSLERFGGWPLPLSIHSRLLGLLSDGGAAGVLYNIAFAGEYAPAEVAQFRDAVRRLPVAVFPAFAERKVPALLDAPNIRLGVPALTPNEEGVMVQARLAERPSGKPTVVGLSACHLRMLSSCTFRANAVPLRNDGSIAVKLRLEQLLADEGSVAVARDRFVIVATRFRGFGSFKTPWAENVPEAEILAHAIAAAIRQVEGPK